MATKSKPRKNRRSDLNYETAIYKVLKQVHPDTGITDVAKKSVDRIIVSMGNQMAKLAAQLARRNERATITSREVQTAIRLILPGELAKHGVSEGTKAVTKFNASLADYDGPRPKGGPKSKPQSKSSRAGLQLQFSRGKRALKEQSGNMNTGESAAVYLVAVLEYLTAEILELSGNAAMDLKVKRITERHLRLAVSGDEELDTLFKHYVLGGGVIPHIHKGFLPDKE